MIHSEREVAYAQKFNPNTGGGALFFTPVLIWSIRAGFQSSQVEWIVYYLPCTGRVISTSSCTRMHGKSDEGRKKTKEYVSSVLRTQYDEIIWLLSGPTKFKSTYNSTTIFFKTLTCWTNWWAADVEFCNTSCTITFVNSQILNSEMNSNFLETNKVDIQPTVDMGLLPLGMHEFVRQQQGIRSISGRRNNFPTFTTLTESHPRRFHCTNLVIITEYYVWNRLRFPK